ncbi:MAG TPA: type ISP restriction/modification enzyme [Thermoanaerobaculia bacterium]|nr:type ISP restriction/modification enzyme [Thermoanaerobaculia bacterium]
MRKDVAHVAKGLREFADQVKRRTKARAAGEPEDQLRGPLGAFLMDLKPAFGRDVIAKGESRLPDRLGQPDFALLVDDLLMGYVEVKAPRKGAKTEQYTGRDREQWNRFKALPNILYTDGNEWALYRDGKRVGAVVSLSGEITEDGKQAVADADAEALHGLLTDCLTWKPIVPGNARELAAALAPLCWLLRDQVEEALTKESSPLVRLASEWRDLLFPDASDAQFADAYAQTVTFALLLARAEGAHTLNLDEPVRILQPSHGLLSRALLVLTDATARQEIEAALSILQRVIDAVAPKALKGGKEDPWLYFYEEFLAEYDAALRKNAGVYYTPVEVVKAQVALIQDLLVNRLGRPLGFAEEGVFTLDPGVGTGTYLLGVIDRALSRVEEYEGKGAVRERATLLARTLNGFEWMVGPYSVAELRVTQALARHGARIPKVGVNIYLTDTLASPHAKPPQPGLFYEPIALQQKRALEVKEKVPVLVCLGNPPYDRHAAEAAARVENRKGGWVRWGDAGKAETAILQEFLEPARKAGYGVHLKNLYNLYVYFWRWALWKVFEHQTSSGPGIVSFISASSYLFGDAFVGMRECLRRQCDEVWIIDLGGEGRGTRREENVFAIQTPVAIAVAVRYGKPNLDMPAKIVYARIRGTRAEKLATLAGVQSLEGLNWRSCPDGWQDKFLPLGRGDYFSWPLLTDLFPWQHSGMQVKRLWPIAPDPKTLARRWDELLQASDRASAFHATRDRTIKSVPDSLMGDSKHLALSEAVAGMSMPPVRRIAYRSFDRQWIIWDNRIGDYMRPVFWQAHSQSQLYFSTLLSQPLGEGPALTASAEVPDLDHFRGSFGAKHVIPLWRDAAATTPNIAPGALEELGAVFGRDVSAEQFATYVYGLLGGSPYTRYFWTELETREIRVPLTKDRDLFERAETLGRTLLRLHTYGDRFVSKGRRHDQVPQGSTRCVRAVSAAPEDYPANFTYDDGSLTLRVGDGQFAPVAKEIWEFEVSGHSVLRSWLSYRMRDAGGGGTSPLDRIRADSWTPTFTRELLELLWVLEATIALYPEQEKVLAEIVEGTLFKASELPVVPDAAREAPPTLRPSHGQMGLPVPKTK